MYQSGNGRVVDSRVGWACFDLKEAGLIERAGRAMYKITESGLEALKSGSDVIDTKYLSQFKSSTNFCNALPVGGIEQPYPAPDDDESKTPDEAIEEAFSELNSRLGPLLCKLPTVN